MTRSSRLFIHACTCALLGASAPAVAGAAWTAPQDLGPAGFEYGTTSLASNDRGDAVTAFSQSRGIRIARAKAGAAFAPSIAVSTDGGGPRVAIDARGVAIIAWQYNDGAISESDGFRGTLTCCVGTKVVVWRPGQPPTRPHVVRRRGVITTLAAVAAASGRRGVLVQTAHFDRSSGDETNGSLQFAPIRLDGRTGKRRTVVRSGWAGGSLQFARGRAVVGLVGQGKATRLAVRSQRATGTFGAIRVFLRVPEKLEFFNGAAEFAEVLMAPDARGGQLAVLQRGRRPKLVLQLVRKPRSGRLRSVIVRRGPAADFKFSPPTASPDGWAAVAFERLPKITELGGFGYVLAVRPSGRSLITRVAASQNDSSPAVAVTRGGAGGAGFVYGNFTVGRLRVASFVPLVAGIPQPSAALTQNTTEIINNPVMTSNRRDRVRVVWEEGDRVLASRLE